MASCKPRVLRLADEVDLGGWFTLGRAPRGQVRDGKQSSHDGDSRDDAVDSLTALVKAMITQKAAAARPPPPAPADVDDDEDLEITCGMEDRLDLEIACGMDDDLDLEIACGMEDDEDLEIAGGMDDDLDAMVTPKVAAAPPPPPPAPAAAPPQTSSFQFTTVTHLQNIRGYWEDVSSLSRFVGKFPEIPDGIRALQGVGADDQRRVFHTILAIAILRKHFMSDHSSWKMIEQKAISWLASVSAGCDWECFIQQVSPNL